MKRKPKVPTWILSDEFGIDRDKYNWIIYVRNGDGNATRWKAVSYHPTPALLLSELYRRVERTIPAHHDFVHHLEVAADRAHSLYTEFLERISTNPSVTPEATSDQHNAEVMK
jgi:hypothetical protein